MRGVQTQGGRSFQRDVHEHVGPAFAHAQTAHAAQGKLLGERLFQSFAVFLAAAVKQRRHRPAGQPDAHYDHDAGYEQGGDGVRHVQDAAEHAVGGQVFAELHAEQAHEHHA